MDKTSSLAAVGCSCCCIVILVLIGAYSKSLNDKFSPVYQDVDCGDEVISVSSVSVSGWNLQLGLGITLTCKNPNAYKIQIVKAHEGKIYYAANMEELGVVTAKRGPIDAGSGQVNLAGVVRLSGFGAIEMIGRFVSGPVHLFLDIRFECMIEQDLLVTNLVVKPSYDQKCGVSIRISGEEAGGVTCAKSFQDLVITEIGVVQKPGSSSMGVDEAVIEDATKSKNLFIGIVMGVCFLCIPLLIVCEGCILFRLWRSSGVSPAGGATNYGTKIGASDA